MKLQTIYPISNRLWAIDEIEKTTMYVYRGSQRALLLDTGFGLSDLPAILKTLIGDLPVIVVNTHSHGDHNGGNCQFDTVYCGRFDEPNNHHQPTEADRQRSLTHFFQALEGTDFDPSSWKNGPSRHVCTLKDGDIIDLGDIQLTVLETPGHTAGCISLFDKANGELFVGDMILSWQVWGQLPTSVSLKVYAESLERLAELEPSVKHVRPAHGIATNPYGFKLYELPPRVLGIYARGTRAILNGQGQSEPFPCFAGDGLVQYFEIGGMVYDPERMD